MLKKAQSFFKKSIMEFVVSSQKFLEENQIFSDVIVSLFVLVFYLFSFEFILTTFFAISDGVNFIFVSRSWKYIAILTVGILIVYFIMTKFSKNETLFVKNTSEKIKGKDFYLLLLPLTFIVQYIINNLEILSFLGAIYVFGFFTLFSSIYVFAIPLLFKFFGSTRSILAVGLAFVTTIVRMALLSHERLWLDVGSLKPQWLFFVYTFIIIWFLYKLNDKKLLRLLVVIFFISNSFFQLDNKFFNEEVPSLPIQENKLVSIVKGKEQVYTPNIYLLVYDAYVINETMLQYGIDNSAQQDYLKGLDFKIYPKTYSVDDHTNGTMTRVLNASTETYGTSRQGVSGDGIVQNVLKSYGYKTYGIFTSDFFFRENDPTYDYFFPDVTNSSKILIEAIMEGAFRFDIGFEEVPHEKYVEKKQSIFENVLDEKIFIYTHSKYPNHSQNSGICLPNETELFKTRLEIANNEMKLDLNIIINNDPGAIIIVAGDHGPSLTKNCARLVYAYDISEVTRLDIQDRFGTFLAIRWPTQDFERFDDITVLQDLFPSIFAYLFNDEGILESKIEPSTLSSFIDVRNGIIYGGINDGEPLFLADD